MEEKCKDVDDNLKVGHFREPAILFFPHCIINPHSKRAKSGNSPPSIVKDGFEGMLQNVLSQVYQKITPKGIENQMGGSWWRVVVGYVPDNPQKVKYYMASVFGMTEYRAWAEGCFSGMQHCMGEVMEHKRLALGVVEQILSIYELYCKPFNK